MAKEDNYEGMDEDELTDEELEELEKEERKVKPKSSSTKSPSTPPQKKPVKTVEEEAQAKKRFVVFAQDPRVGIIDSETREIIGEGESAILQTLCDILERLERMETNMGVMLNE